MFYYVRVYVVVHTHTHTRCGVEYIAHAGGCIDGYLYTNSLEAVQQSLTFGVRNIELDLCLTNDNQIVAAHDWGYYNYLTGYGSDDTTALSLTEFQSVEYVVDILLLRK